MAKKPVDTKAAERAARIDELGKLEAEIAVLKSKEALAKTIREYLRGEVAGFPSEEGALLFGTKYASAIGAAENEREVPDKHKIFEVLGKDAFVSIATLPLGKLDVVLPNAEKDGLIKKARTGTRSVTTMLRAEV
jgi:tRNA(Ser,Leu) C12 N-acetylase TAN1